MKAQPGVDKVVAIAGLAALNDSASLSNAGVAYVILKDWEERGKKEDLLGLYKGLSARVPTSTTAPRSSSRRPPSRASATSPAPP